MGAQRSEGGRSILCLKSTAKVGGKPVSNIVLTLPPGTPVTVPRQLADTIVTEWGAADLKHLDAVQRAHALVGIAHPDFRDGLIAQARRAGLWERRPGFDTFARRALFNNLGYLRKLTGALEAKPAGAKAGILFGELKKMIAAPDLKKRLKGFFEQNRA
jgi:Acetyl-CoA hydrolase/transferase C-terminal domain